MLGDRGLSPAVDRRYPYDRRDGLQRSGLRAFMLIFRVATYYLPVLISCFYSLLIYWRERQAHKKAVI